MELKIDVSRSYGIALEGGGAKGAYQIGVWKAIKEIGLNYHMVSGTSVGALNGALFTMGDLDLALSAWENIHISQVVNVQGTDEKTMLKICTNQLDFSEMRSAAPQLLSILHNRGLDVQPLREWVRSIVDPAVIRKSKTELFVCTYSISERRGKDIRINDLPEDEICDMLLASAYFPAFKLEKLSGKLYTDGGFVDSLPVNVLIDHNCRDILCVRLPVIGVHRKVRKPDNVNITTIETNADLGSVLEFDAERARKNIEIGYYDAMRVFYGLYGKTYYIDRTMTEEDAMNWLIRRYAANHPEESLRSVCEKRLPQNAKKLGAEKGDYYDLFIAVLEKLLIRRQVDPFAIRTDAELLDLIK